MRLTACVTQLLLLRPVMAIAFAASAFGAVSSTRELQVPTRVPLSPGARCETPYSANVRVHVIITVLNRAYYRDLRYLGAVGLSNADVFAYLRTRPQDEREWKLQVPCGMRFHERLLLPNIGEEGATFLTHVAASYNDLPDAIINLHGGPLHVWHAHCSVAIRRMRAFYRGLGNGTEATPVMKAFAADMVTLNSMVPDHPHTRVKGGFLLNDCCGPLLNKRGLSHDYPECPWERVGDSPILLDGLHPQALCQLRDRTPDTNWTLLSSDVPDFFVRPREVLAKYERDPLHLVHVTHHVPGVSARMKPAPRKRLLLSRSEPETRAAPSEAPADGDTRPRPLANYRDVVLPQHSESRLKRPASFAMNHAVYGLDRMWIWLLKAHGLYHDFARRPGPGERVADFCCFQFAVPRHVLLSAPKAFWDDAVFLTTHSGWKPRHEWPVALGYLIEWRLRPSLNRRHLTKAGFQAYVDIERELGEDERLGQCAAELSVPLQ